MSRPNEHDRKRWERRCLLEKVVNDLDGVDRVAEVLGVGRWRVQSWLSGRTLVEEPWWIALQSIDRLLRLRALPPAQPPSPTTYRRRPLPASPVRRPSSQNPDTVAAAAILRRQRRGLPALITLTEGE